MRKKRVPEWLLSFTDIFNTSDDEAKGRVIQLSSSILAAFYNVFITGIFYTGFLTMYGMSITDTGIITFIPFIANLFSIFSNKILSRFKRPKKMLIASKIIFYALYIVATTAMPLVVIDPKARLVCFVVILFVAYAFFAPFSPGFTTWFYNFYPKDNKRRASYLTLLQIFASVMSSLTLLFSSVLTDMLSDSPYQDTLIIIFRYVAFGLVLIDVLVQSRAKEYPSPVTPGLKLLDVFTLPFKYKKFMACMVLQFVWNYIANLNNGLWSYHLLNHMNFPYILINAMSIMYTFLLIMISPIWQKVLHRYSWVKTFGIAQLLWFPTEFIFFFMTPDTAWIYIPMSTIQNIIAVGLNISYANILYTNLPAENSTTHIVFNTIGCNICAFFGLISGTFLSGITGDNTIRMLGMDVYSVQYTVIARGVLIGIMGLILVKKWKIFTRDADVAEIEEMARVRKEYRKQKKARSLPLKARINEYKYYRERKKAEEKK